MQYSNGKIIETLKDKPVYMLLAIINKIGEQDLISIDELFQKIREAASEKMKNLNEEYQDIDYSNIHSDTELRKLRLMIDAI